jgi:SulP family sulfate permease
MAFGDFFKKDSRTPGQLARDKFYYYLPIARWLPRYDVQRNLLYDIAAGITVAMMLIPQEISLASLMNVPAHNGLYTAATAPLVYALFGSSTVLSVASGSEVSLLVGSTLEDIEDEEARVATGVFMSFLIGALLLLIRILNLSQIADFFARPVMGGFISAGGLLVMLSQVPNLFTIKVAHSDYPVQIVYYVLKDIGSTKIPAFVIGVVSIALLIFLKLAKKRFFPLGGGSALFKDDAADTNNDARDVQTPATDGNAAGPSTASHGFTLTDQDYVRYENDRAVSGKNPNSAEARREWLQNKPPATRTLLYAARFICDLGPLLVCVLGGILGYILGPKKLKLTGDVPSGFPEPKLPWYGYNEGLIQDDFATIFIKACTVALVVYLSSIAMSKRLAIQRGEDINTDQELTGLSLASIVCGFFQAMPPTGGMSRTAVNFQNARTQLSSILTCLIVIVALYILTGAMSYLPKVSLAAIIIVAGYSLVEFREAKWLYKVRRDEFWVWTLSFVLTLGLGVLKGLIASLIVSVLSLMLKVKIAPLVALGELENGSFVDRKEYPHARAIDGVVAVRVESSIMFANAERVSNFIDDEVALATKSGNAVRGVVLDAQHINDVDATTIQVLSDIQEKLASRKAVFAIANAKGRVHDVIANTNLIKRLVARNPSVTIEGAVAEIRSTGTAHFEAESGTGKEVALA